ncbi:NTE family protein [Methylobacterium sp. BE186]|uniref:patatin-like phospholipase family protein n=1 Tax=Methylobacterium sp. BE186 TaxID=2817715 RepID=UPI00286238AA|nr:patatin-like phospholipase family protein [Methylobacterium sp. BE186]MDR7038803.1 NTE family protein [Methylobacterium sp. BE186]
MDAAIPASGSSAPAEDFLGGKKLEHGIGLCLSGGGFRAMLFHVGALTRLNEAGLLPRLDRVSSVSGGSIAAGALAVGWNRLRFDDRGVASNLREEVGLPLLALAQKWVDVPAVVLGLLPRLSAAGIAGRVYDRTLFGGATLQDLPDRPRFTFTATSLQTGALWRFAKEYAAEYHVGEWKRPDLRVADVVSASAAFPPYMSPAYVRVPHGAMAALEEADLHEDGYKGRLCLTDGGVYDNVGLEPIWKRYRTILVSDGGRAMPGNPLPRSNWFSQALRVSDIALQQGIFLRQRVLRGLDRMGERKLVSWGIGEGVEAHGPDNPLGFSEADTKRAAAVKTRLKRFPDEIQEVVMRAGYAHADAALRKSGLAIVPSTPSFDGLPTLSSRR